MEKDEASLSSEPNQLWLGLALAGGLCWSGAIALLFMADLHRELDPFTPQRVLFYVLTIAAGLFTFVPLQLHLGLPRLALQGVGGSSLLLYTLAFVPPPTDWLFSLPELPVYLLLIVALFWTSTAIALPFLYALGQRIFKQRVLKGDVRRAKRQAYEIGTLFACTTTLAGLRVLTWVSFLLLILILVMVELLFLSRIEAGGAGRTL